MATTDPSVRTPVLPGIVPYINVEGANDASAFYQKAFGAKEISRAPAPDGKRLMHCRLEINGGPLMMTDAFPEHGHGFQPSHSFALQLVVEDGEAWWNRAVEAGCQVIMPFQKMFWGDRWGQLIDPFQIRWSIDEPAKD